MSNRNYYTDMLRVIDSLFEDIRNIPSIEQPSRFNKAISSASFPPSNVLVNPDTKVLTIQVALVGCEEKDISLSFDADYLRLCVNKETGDKEVKEGESVVEYVFQRGLRLVEKAEVSWLIDPRYYDRETVKVEFKNGLLTINIYPRSEVAPKKINIFGGLTDKLIEEKKE